MMGLGRLPIPSAFDIDMDRPLRLRVVQLETGTVEHTLDVSGLGLIVSHVINSFVDHGVLVVDLIGYDFLFFNRSGRDIQQNKTRRDSYGHRAQSFRVRAPLDGSAPGVEEII